MPIAQESILPILDPHEYKVHIAYGRDDSRPLDVFVRDRSEWEDWNRWRHDRDRFNLPYTFSLIHFYHEPNIWLFGGIYRVMSRSPENHSHSYEVELDQSSAELIGRLKIYWQRSGRNDSIRLTKDVYAEMVVSERRRVAKTRVPISSGSTDCERS